MDSIQTSLRYGQEGKTTRTSKKDLKSLIIHHRDVVKFFLVPFLADDQMALDNRSSIITCYGYKYPNLCPSEEKKARIRLQFENEPFSDGNELNHLQLFIPGPLNRFF
jgi:hypothetical protein